MNKTKKRTTFQRHKDTRDEKIRALKEISPEFTLEELAGAFHCSIGTAWNALNPDKKRLSENEQLSPK